MSEVEKTIERRHSLRIPAHLKFQYINASGENVEAITKNINSTGLLFSTKREIALDSDIKIVIDLPGSPLFTLEAKGRIVRIEKINSSEFDIGVKFINVSSEQEQELKNRLERINLVGLLDKINKKEISDIHLTVNSPAMVRRYGEIKPLNDQVLTSDEIKQMVYSILTEEQTRIFEANKDLDFSFSPNYDSRYRVSIFQQRGKVEVVFRNILPFIKTRQELGLPDVIDDLCKLRDGIIIIAGSTGAGKTTTITTMIDIINRDRGGVILSLEKPIEYLHRNINGIVKQREVGTDVTSFASGIKAALRQDPDVIIVGECLDADTFETVLQAGETGHLVITSLHATDTVQIFDRILSFFPTDQKHLIFSRLSHSLKATIMQKLLVHKSGIGRVLATEVCVANTAVKRTIASGDFTQLYSVIQTGSQYKMHLMQDSVDNLFEQGLISAETFENLKQTIQIKK